MIYNYEIKKTDDVEIIYLYFNINEELGIGLFNYQSSNNIINIIKKFINDIGIKVDKQKVVLVINGIMIATILLKSVIFPDNYKISIYCSNYDNLSLQYTNNIIGNSKIELITIINNTK